jgi:hypothetical protein
MRLIFLPYNPIKILYFLLNYFQKSFKIRAIFYNQRQSSYEGDLRIPLRTAIRSLPVVKFKRQRSKRDASGLGKQGVMSVNPLNSNVLLRV